MRGGGGGVLNKSDSLICFVNRENCAASSQYAWISGPMFETLDQYCQVLPPHLLPARDSEDRYSYCGLAETALVPSPASLIDAGFSDPALGTVPSIVISFHQCRSCHHSACHRWSMRVKTCRIGDRRLVLTRSGESRPEVSTRECGDHEVSPQSQVPPFHTFLRDFFSNSEIYIFQNWKIC